MMMTMMTKTHCLSVEAVWSGGQTGADRGGLDFAREAGLAMGGYCPKGRKAEDGAVPALYPLSETASADYLERTRLNVERTDGTLIVHNPPLKGGSSRTLWFADNAKKPVLVIAMTEDLTVAAGKVRAWIEAHQLKLLNVAGTRASRAYGIHDYTLKLLRAAFSTGISV